MRSGACFDGLQTSGVNRNQGAESTLAHLWTKCEVPSSTRRLARASRLRWKSRNSRRTATKDFFQRAHMLRDLKPPALYTELFHRHASNPILTAQDWPYPAHTVFNAGRVSWAMKPSCWSASKIDAAIRT